jgi:hypothetical protein
MHTISPGPHARVCSPLHCTVRARGMWPTGTWSGSSCTRSSWYLTNLDPRVCMCTRPVDLSSLHRCDMQRFTGMNWFPVTSWNISEPHISHTYVTTVTIGFTSVTRVTMPFTDTKWPISNKDRNCRNSKSILTSQKLNAIKRSTPTLRFNFPHFLRRFPPVRYDGHLESPD